MQRELPTFSEMGLVKIYVKSVAPAGVGQPGHCPGISAHYISRDLSKCTALRARMYVYRVRRCDVARGHGLWRSRVNLESVEAQSVHSHLCLPGLLLVSAGASQFCVKSTYTPEKNQNKYIVENLSHRDS